MGNPAAIIVGVAQCWIAPANTVSPAFATTGLVTPPTTPWALIGDTETGVTLNVDRKTVDIYVEEQSNPVLVVPDTTAVTIDISFAEDTILNMQTAYGGGTIVTTAPSATVPGTTTLTLADALESLAVSLIATNQYGLSRLVYIPNMISGGKVKTSYLRAKAARSYPATFTAVCPMADIVITDATAPIT